MTASTTASAGTTPTYACAKSVKIGGHTLLWGITANNNPTVQDVWNTIPAWSFPFISSALAPSPTVTTFIEQVYAQQVAGLSAYSFLDDTFYFEFGGYRPLSTHTQLALGVDTTGQSPISGVAPYWRAAAEKNVGNHSWEVGTFGLASQVTPLNISAAGTELVHRYRPRHAISVSRRSPHGHRSRRLDPREPQHGREPGARARRQRQRPAAVPERLGLVYLRPYLERDRRAGLGRRHR